VDVGNGWAVVLSSATWLAVSLVVGRWAAGWPAARLATTGPITTLRPWEASGAWWQRHLRVRRWKDGLPEAGAFFAGGESKRHVGSRSTEALSRFRRETVRAERVHWIIMATTPVHLVWCRPPLAAAMVAFGVLFNAPFIVIQRHNRGRIDTVLARRA
jgi:glycosyl-4,4'-diaponeurosporenoate acyltransferase